MKKLLPSWLPIAGVTVIVLGLVWLIGSWTELSARDGRHRACVVAVKGGPNAPGAIDVCEPAIAAADRLADRTLRCDLALTGNDGLAVENTCSTPVKALVAKAVADARTIASAREQLASADQERDQAVARAELRGAAQAQRDLRAKLARDGAPRGPDGLSVYDAERLRDRWGGQAQP